MLSVVTDAVLTRNPAAAKICLNGPKLRLRWIAVREKRPDLAIRGPASTLPSRPAMDAPHEMDCPECAAHVAPMPGSTWAIAWYSCDECGTFWYARLRVGPGSDAIPARRMIGSGSKTVAPPLWTLEELEAEADALRRESDNLPKGNLEALRLHLEKLKVLADAINKRLDSHASHTPAPVGVRHPS